MSDQLQAVRDEIAEMCGFHKHPNLGWCRDTTPISDDCPIPACLNFVSRVWPNGVAWRRVWEYYDETDDYEDYTGYLKWYATIRIGTDEKQNVVGLRDSGDELTDRMTLLLRSLKWLRDNDRPAFDAACEKIRKECGK